jgi:hypothetical protein
VQDGLFPPVDPDDRALANTGDVEVDLATGPVRHKLLLALGLKRWRQVEDGVNIEGFDPNGVVHIRTQELSLAVQRARTPLYKEQGFLNYTGKRTLVTNWDARVLYQLTPRCRCTAAPSTPSRPTAAGPAGQVAPGPGRRQVPRAGRAA